MRPQGEERIAIKKAAEELAAECSAATWRELSARAKVGFRVGRITVENMARGPRAELEAVGSVKKAHSKRWMTLYAPVTQQQPVAEAAPSLDAMVRSWSRG